MWPSLLFLAAPILAAIAAAWGLWRRKWYAFLPAILVGLAAVVPASLTNSSIERIAAFTLCLERLTVFTLHVQPRNVVLTLLLVDAAAVGCLTALWTGWSRASHWFWRLSALAGVPAALSLVKANEPIALAFVVMPTVAAAAWWVRRRRDRKAVLTTASTGRERSRFRWQIRDALLLFIVVGLTALAIRSLVAGPFYVRWEGFVTLATALVLLSLLAAGTLGALSSIWRWISAAACAVLIAAVTTIFVSRHNDVLGLGPLFHQPYIDMVAPGLFLMAAFGIPATVCVTTGIYRWSAKTTAKGTATLAKAILLIAVVALTAPLLLVGVQMLPPAISSSHSGLAARPLADESSTFEQLVSKDWGLGWAGDARLSDRFDRKLSIAAEILKTPDRIWVDPADYARRQRSNPYDHELRTIHVLFCHFDRALWIAASEGDSDHVKEYAEAQQRIVELLSTSNLPLHVHTAEAFQFWTMCNYVDLHEYFSLEETRAVLEDSAAFLARRPSSEERYAADAALRQHCETWRERLASFALKLSMPRASRGEAGPDKAEMLRQDHQTRVNHEALRVRLALEVYHRRHHQWPERLDELTPSILNDVPVDPFSQQPRALLLYRRTVDAFVLYSRGPDGIDNGGNFSGNSFETRMPGYDLDLQLDLRAHGRAFPWRMLPVAKSDK